MEKITRRADLDHHPAPLFFVLRSVCACTVSVVLILSPAGPASHALVKTGHGLIGTADLDLEEGSLVTVAVLCGTLNATLLGIIPGTWAAKDILFLLALVLPPREDGVGYGVLKGTCSALEAVQALVCEGDGEDVGAVWADYFTIGEEKKSSQHMALRMDLSRHNTTFIDRP